MHHLYWEVQKASIPGFFLKPGLDTGLGFRKAAIPSRIKWSLCLGCTGSIALEFAAPFSPISVCPKFCFYAAKNILGSAIFSPFLMAVFSILFLQSFIRDYFYHNSILGVSLQCMLSDVYCTAPWAALSHWVMGIQVWSHLGIKMPTWVGRNKQILGASQVRKPGDQSENRV